jgi:hypothetical protein
MNRAKRSFIAVLVLALCSGLVSLCAQEQKNTEPETGKNGADQSKTNSENPAKPVHAYRVDFSIHELEDGKKINTRHYSMDLNSGPWSGIKIGTRVPVSPSQGTFQYVDLGTNIDCELTDEGEDVSLDVRSDFSNLASPEEQHSTQPIIRQIKINGRTVTSLGKPVIIGSVDDPNSNRQFQLEATVTRLK